MCMKRTPGFKPPSLTTWDQVKLTLRCSKCGSKHLELHDLVAYEKCYSCGYKSAWATSFPVDMRIKRILAVSGNGLVIRCPRCGSERASGNIDALNEEGHFMCQVCQYTGFWRYFRFSRYRICAWGLLELIDGALLSPRKNGDARHVMIVIS